MRIVVDIDPGEPVSGAAGRDGDPLVRFDGMLGFLALFEQLRNAGRHTAGSDPSSGGSRGEGSINS